MRALILIASASLFATPVAFAQSSPDVSIKPDDIVVNGQRQQSKRIGAFVRTLTPVKPFDQIGKFHYAVCPAVVGLGPYNREVEVRVRKVTAAAGAPVGKKRCRANLLVIATTDKRLFIDSIAQFAPGLINGLSKKRVYDLAHAAGPVASWQLTGLIDADGVDPQSDPMTGLLLVAWRDPSRITRPVQVHFTGSVLVVEREALRGVSTRQLADFAVMRTLAPVDPLSYRHALSGNPTADLPAPSILTLFDSEGIEGAPASVTWWDFAFLQALYRSHGEYSASFQRSEIQANMKRILADVPPEEL